MSSLSDSQFYSGANTTRNSWLTTISAQYRAVRLLPGHNFGKRVARTLVDVQVIVNHTVRKNKKRLREINEVRTSLRAQLDAEVLAVSKLVTDRCPNSLEAHRLVIEAAQCLVLPYSARRIITADDYRNRYQNGFDLLKQARAVAAAA